MSAPTCRPTPVTPPIVVMGVCGAGKSVIGAQLADTLGLPFLDGDDLHPAANVAKMSQGLSLTDEDRRPWLAAVGSWLADHCGSGAVMACSALKRSYRDQLRAACPGIVFIHLAGDQHIVTHRVTARPDHFMPPSLVTSQYQALEPLQDDETGITLDFDQSVDDLVHAARQWLGTAAAT